MTPTGNCIYDHHLQGFIVPRTATLLNRVY